MRLEWSSIAAGLQVEDVVVEREVGAELVVQRVVTWAHVSVKEIDIGHVTNNK